jgi:hypothetical protein
MTHGGNPVRPTSLANPQTMLTSPQTTGEIPTISSRFWPARLAAADASLVSEQAKTEKAISAFASLADRLDALATERAKPWWRRLAGG